MESLISISQGSFQMNDTDNSNSYRKKEEEKAASSLRPHRNAYGEVVFELQMD